MVSMIGCTCDGLPAHDHFIGCRVIDGVYQAYYDLDDVGHVWVDWKAVARALMEDASPQPPSLPALNRSER